MSKRTRASLNALDAIEVFLTVADAPFAFDKPLGVLRKVAVRNGFVSIAATALPVALGVR